VCDAGYESWAAGAGCTGAGTAGMQGHRSAAKGLRFSSSPPPPPPKACSPCSQQGCCAREPLTASTFRLLSLPALRDPVPFGLWPEQLKPQHLQRMQHHQLQPRRRHHHHRMPALRRQCGVQRHTGRLRVRRRLRVLGCRRRMHRCGHSRHAGPPLSRQGAAFLLKPPPPPPKACSPCSQQGCCAREPLTASIPPPLPPCSQRSSALRALAGAAQTPALAAHATPPATAAAAASPPPRACPAAPMRRPTPYGTAACATPAMSPGLPAPDAEVRTQQATDLQMALACWMGRPLSCSCGVAQAALSLAQCAIPAPPLLTPVTLARRLCCQLWTRAPASPARRRPAAF
jgi:hypothetical protein